MPDLNLDLTNDTVLSSRDPLPTGDYMVIITDSTVKPTKDSSGRYLELTLQVIDGEHKGRLVWDRIGLWYASEKAVEVARRTLKSITEAIGHPPTVQKSESLHDKPLIARVALQQDAGYGPKNEVKGYRASTGAAPQPRPTAPLPQGGGSRPAWAK